MTASHDALTAAPAPRTAGPRVFVPALQSLRGVAALWVVLYHLDVALHGAKQPLLPGGVTRVGWLGVDLFFVLSAYLLGQPFLEGRAPRYGKFLTERFLRIAPAYYASAVVAAIVMVVWFPERWRPLDAAASLVFLNNSTVQTFAALNPPFWSLAVEMHFYLVLPLMARVFSEKLWRIGLVLTFAAGVLFRFFTFDPAHAWMIFAGAFWLPGFLGHFGLGLAAARRRTVQWPLAATAIGALLIAMPVALWITPDSVVYGFDSLLGQALVRPLAAIGFALIVMAAASEGVVRRVLEFAPLKVLGDMSYSLYLIHLPVQLVVEKTIGIAEHPMAYVVVGGAASLITGGLFYVLVERPAERWRHRRKKKPATDPGVGEVPAMASVGE